jgi:hypothetical protein
VIYEGEISRVDTTEGVNSFQLLLANGQGKLTHLNRLSYEGTFYLGMYDGYGTLLDKTNKLIFEGHFLHN